MILPLILTALNNRYVQLILAVTLTAIVVGTWQRYEGYNKEHKLRIAEVQELNDKITAGAIKAFKLSEASSSAIYQADKLLQQKNKEIAKVSEELKKRIRENEELKSIVIPNSAVRLHNDSIDHRTNQQGVQNQTIAGDDASASSAKTTLADLIERSAENNINHLACVAQVQSLQLFVCKLYEADGQPLEYPVCHD